MQYKGVTMNIKRIIGIIGSLVMVSNSIFSVSATTDDANSINYAKALQQSLYFYDANLCGNTVTEHSLFNWREDCHAIDCSVSTDYGTLDLSGGFHDAGDHVKFGLTQAYTLSMLGLGYYNFSDGYIQTGQQPHIKNISTYFADYFKKCTVLDDNGNVKAFCYQVGDGEIDHSVWTSPEQQQGERPALFATPKNPCTDIVANTSGALAMYYINFKDDEALEYAEKLYQFAKSNDKKVATIGCKDYYETTSYLDDLSWACACLYKATGDTSYLDECKEYLKQAGEDYLYSGWCPDWSDVWLMTATMIEDWDTVSNTLDDLISDTDYKTPQGFYYFTDWGSNRYNSNTQVIGLIYDKYNDTDKYTTWAKSQMDYILGDNDSNTCYMVGYSESSVKHPHHCASSGLDDFPQDNDTTPQKHVLVGALVGGVGKDDNYHDTTDDYQCNEVAIDYNAGFSVALSGLYLRYGKNDSISSSIVGTDVLLGDINCDKSIGYIDLLLLKKYLFNMTSIDTHKADYLNANVNGDSTIDVMDIITLKSLIL